MSFIFLCFIAKFAQNRPPLTTYQYWGQGVCRRIPLEALLLLAPPGSSTLVPKFPVKSQTGKSHSQLDLNYSAIGVNFLLGLCRFFWKTFPISHTMSESGIWSGVSSALLVELSTYGPTYWSLLHPNPRIHKLLIILS